MIGDTSISSIGDGTITGAISALNTGGGGGGSSSRGMMDVTTLVTDSSHPLKSAITDQNLEKYGLQIGDYFTGPSSGYKYAIAHMNPYKGNGNYVFTSYPHMGLLVQPGSTSKYHNSGNVTHFTSATICSSTASLGSPIVNDLSYLGVTYMDHGIFPSSMGFQARSVTLLTQMNVLGSNIFSGDGVSNTFSYDHTAEACFQLEIFKKYDVWKLFGGNIVDNFWFREVYTNNGTSQGIYMSTKTFPTINVDSQNTEKYLLALLLIY